MSDSRKKNRNLILFKAPSIKTVSYYIFRHRRCWNHLGNIPRFINVCPINTPSLTHHFLVFIHFARRSSCLQMFKRIDWIGHLFSVQFKIPGKLVLSWDSVPRDYRFSVLCITALDIPVVSRTVLASLF